MGFGLARGWNGHSFSYEAKKDMCFKPVGSKVFSSDHSIALSAGVCLDHIAAADRGAQLPD